MALAADFVGLLLRQTGDAYVLGHEVAPEDDEVPDFDCSALVEWACARLGVRPRVPVGGWAQARHCRDHNRLIEVGAAVLTQGALLFRFAGVAAGRPESVQVGVSLGNRSSVEARGKTWGVGSWTDQGRGWTHAALIPGLDYFAPAAAPTTDGSVPSAPPWPGRYLAQPPFMVGEDVRRWQARMAEIGWPIAADGRYGPASAAMCQSLQRQRGLLADGVVGPSTWDLTFG